MDEEKRYWKYYKELRASGVKTEQAILKAHQLIDESF
jgi:hypothetical protein